jgi:hypothetical protein
LAKLDVEFASKLTVFPVSVKDNGKTLLLAVPNPGDLELIDQVSKRARIRVQVGIAGEHEIRQAIDRHYRNKINAEPTVRHAPLNRRESVIDSSAEGSVDPDAAAESATLSPTAGWTDANRERLESLYLNQLKVEKILSALTELLGEKGLLPHR